MQLYRGSSPEFIHATVQNQIADRLREAFFSYYRRNPPQGEVQAWRNSLRAMKDVIQNANLLDHGILLEYQLPLSSKRIDCMVTGLSDVDKAWAVIVELKQWEQCKSSDGEYIVTWLGGGQVDVLHPSVQAYQYKDYLEDTHAAFYEQPPVGLASCSYLHNYTFGHPEPLLDEKYARFCVETPVFSKDDVDVLSGFLRERLGRGRGMPILERIVSSKFRPSRKLMDHVSAMIRGQPEYHLLDDQLVAYDRILTLLKSGLGRSQKQVVLVKGGPGTGKSVIALNLMADALKAGHATHYATGSKAFTETLRKVVGARGGQLFRYFNSYTDAGPGEIDLLVCDEAHRIRKTSESRFTPKGQRRDVPQVHELLRASKVCVFFIDDHQVVRPNEIGSVAYIKQEAEGLEAKVWEYELTIQFRCGGSDAFVQWIESTLGIRRTAATLWEGHPDFEFRIMDSPHELEAAIRRRVSEGYSGRVAAGFCWKWSDPNLDGTLKEDVVVGDYKRPWDARYDARRLAPGIPKASLWAHDPRGIDQVGCVYTAQGFEFDYVGVIFGRDLYYDPVAGQWKGRPKESHDTMVKRAPAADFVTLVGNTYRVLLSRGIRGCYVHFMDPDTRNFFMSRMDLQRLVEHGRSGGMS